MTDIPNTEYITINKDGIFVGGKPATHYRGEEIAYIADVRKYFAEIQKYYPNVTELHVLSSEPRGEYNVAGNPSGKHGPNVWCRVRFSDGRVGSWVFYYTYGSAANCAYFCAYRCALCVRYDADFRSAVFDATIEKQNVKPVTKSVQPQNPELKKLEQGDFAKLPKSPIELNGYKIVVKKIAETQQIKR